MTMNPMPDNPMPERIACAAIRVEGVVYSVPSPGRHHHVIHALVTLGVEDAPIVGDEGFVTSKGIFVDREAARLIALTTGQVLKTQHASELFSEDLWR